MSADPRSSGLIARVRTSLVEHALDVLFPPRCVGCGEFETFICTRCRLSLEVATDSPCLRCGRPGVTATLAGRCAWCMGEEFGFQRAGSAFLHQGVARQMVASFKFEGVSALAETMALLATPSFAAFVEALGDPLVTWVPAHPAAQRRRGYNQAELLARALARSTGALPVKALARKRARTHHQQSLGRAERQRNLRNAFESLDSDSIATDGQRLPRSVVVVDDVFTTGATASEVAGVISAGTGLPVHVFTFSRAASHSGPRPD